MHTDTQYEICAHTQAHTVFVYVETCIAAWYVAGAAYYANADTHMGHSQCN